MKKHAIIPIFIPHEGCPFTCSFCNQNKITAHLKPVSAEDVRNTIETYLSTLENRSLDIIEIAFFGGSFTGIPLDKQSAYLSIAKEYKDAGRVQKLHLSTRPDYINKEILDNLKKYTVNVIELGVQSFDDSVLFESNRGYKSDIVAPACKMIKDYGFELGIQLMIGLPCDSLEKCIHSAEESVKIGPSIARLYPLVLIQGTALYDDFEKGIFEPLDQESSVLWSKEMYKILDAANINIIRVGLKSSDIITENGEIAHGTFHPAFRQLVEGDIAYEKIVSELEKHPGYSDYHIYSNGKSFSNAVGNSGRNRKKLELLYPECTFRFIRDDTLGNMEFRVNSN